MSCSAEALLRDEFNYMRGGTFVEAGALDGVTESPTYELEKDYGWRGLCVEPNPAEYAKLCKVRAWTDPRGLSSVDGMQRFLFGSGESVTCGGLDAMLRAASRRAVLKGPRTKSNVECVTLDRMLQEHELTRVDLLVLDTEGAEVAILAACDLERLPVDVIVVEEGVLGSVLIQLLTGAGYELRRRYTFDMVFRRRA